MTNMTQSDSILLSRLLADFVFVEGAKDRLVLGVCLDSRSLKKGDLFFALTGAGFDGRPFIEDAIKKGAIAVVVEVKPGEMLNENWMALSEQQNVPLFAVPNLHQHAGELAARFYRQPSSGMRVVGITGTNGKTSVSQFVAQCLSDDDRACGIIGTLGFGFFGQLQNTGFTTPQSVQLQSSLAQLRDAGARYVSMEVSSHGLQQGRVNGVQFELAVLTNLTRDHLDYHGDMQAYAAAKSQLFGMPGLRGAVLNRDDELGQKLLRDMQGSHITCIAYGLGLDESAEYLSAELLSAHIIERDQHGMTLEISGSYGDARLHSKLLGEFNAYNLLAVLGTLLLLGFPLEQAVERLQKVVPPPGRMECFQQSGAPLVVVDYAHTPDALAEVLRTLREHCVGDLWVVFGCGGDRDSGKRPEMAKIAQSLADHIVVTNDNPRTEDPQQIIEQIIAGFDSSYAAKILLDREQAIGFAIEQAGSSDIVLIAGKGHEDYQLIGSQRLYFSDRECVSKFLGLAA